MQYFKTVLLIIGFWGLNVKAQNVEVIEIRYIMYHRLETIKLPPHIFNDVISKVVGDDLFDVRRLTIQHFPPPITTWNLIPERYTLTAELFHVRTHERIGTCHLTYMPGKIFRDQRLLKASLGEITFTKLLRIW